MKFYSEIIALCGRFFGIADATETEIHQALTEAKTYEELKTDALKEAGLTLDKINDVSAKVEAMTTEMSEMKAENATQAEKIEGLGALAKDLGAAIQLKDETIAKQLEKIDALSQDLAGYKVVSTPAGVPVVPMPSGESIAVKDTPRSTQRQVVSNEQFKEMFN